MLNIRRLQVLTAALVIATPMLGHADIYGTATFVTDEGESVSSDRLLMDEANPEGKGAWSVKLKQTDSWVDIEYSRLKKITVSTLDECDLEKGVVTLKNGKAFEVVNSTRLTWALFEAEKHAFEVPVVDPVNGGQTMRRIACSDVREIIFPDKAAGSFRKSEDGRYYPPEYVFDPITGKKMPLVDGVGRTSRSD